MKYERFLFLMLVFLSLTVTACSNEPKVDVTSEVETEDMKIVVQKRIENQNDYENFREITQKEQVQKVKEIINGAVWENAEVEMAEPPHYKFRFRNLSPEEVSLHEVWISPKNDKLEIINRNKGYTQLTKENSSLLFEILTGEPLSELK
ncbi:hypothetical protein ACFFHM_18050 [Halalkalibacter kiskunsagensis]|uniref:YhfM-like domain-containing protein n=1 Tax=Halalkalibacter kiskunsagensis TaxID=1548599 RepID=A0ABV6KH09_9BACI